MNPVLGRAPSGKAWGRAARRVVMLVWLSAVACSSDADRAEVHLESGSAHLADGRRIEATLEYLSALQFDPQSVEANNRLAEIELSNGNLAAALTYTQDAHRVDPTDVDAAVRLAVLLQSDQPERAKALVDGVIEQEPDNPKGYMGRSDLALARGRIREAVLAARKAMEVAPEDPGTDWHYGYILQAMIRDGQIRGEEVADNVYTEALHGFERYIAKGGDAPWKAQVEEARIMAAWPTKGREAAAMFRIAVQNSLDNGARGDQLQAAAWAANYAREVGADDLLEWLLERIVELDPRDLRSWQTLSDLSKRQGGDPEEVWQRAIAALPESPQVHIEYARFMIFQWKLDEALAYLAQRAGEGIDPPMLLSAVASTEIAAGRVDDARATVRGLERDHPGHPRTVLGRAQLDMRRGKISKAARSLRELTEQFPSPEAYRLLARAEQVSDRSDSALAAINRSIELDPYFNYDGQGMRARLLADRGDCRGSIRNLLAIREQMPLSNEDTVLLARCRYKTGWTAYGRKLLKDLLARRLPPIEAILLFARMESSDPENASLALQELEKFLRRNPRHWEAVRELTRLDIEADRGSLALARLDRLLLQKLDEVPASIRLLRAKLSAEQGREAGTLADAKAAFEAKPRLRGALELLVALHLRKGNLEAATAATEEAQRAGAFDDTRRLLLGQLYRMDGRDEDALSVFEKATATGAEDPALYYHMGLALRSLDRSEEALRAFEKALSISTSFPEATDARRALEGARGASAS